MPGSRLEGFIQSLGLEAEDVPKVVGAFVCCKYATWGTGIVLGVRYQPLRRLLLGRSAIGKAQPWAQRQRLRLLEVWDQARRTPTVRRLILTSSHNAPAPRPPTNAATQAPSGVSSRGTLEATGKDIARASMRKTATAQRRRFGAGVSDVKRRTSFHWREAMHSALSEGWRSSAGRKLLQCKQRAGRKLRATYSAISARWRSRTLRLQKLVQRQRLLRQKQLVQLRASPAPSKWYSWVSAKYWKYADKLEALARTSSAGRFFSTNFGLKPQGLALGFAEGTILFKFTSPLVLPLQLWLLVNFFKRQRLQTFLAAAPASCDDSSVHREGSEEEQLRPV